MQITMGGIVKYVGVRLLPCPDEPACVGQVIDPARIDILCQGIVAQSFALRGGDELLVADGAEVASGAQLVAYHKWRRTLRAAIPEGVEAVVHWSAPIARTLDEVTGLPRLHVARHVAPLVLELRVDDAAIVTLSVDRRANPIADTGAVVRRGDPLASLFDDRWDRNYNAGIENTRAFLDARRPRDRATALIAPRDATVIDIGQRWIVLRTTDERVLRLRRRPGTHVLVAVGDTVLAGDVLTDGERNHRALLHAWGEHQLSEHILDELAVIVGRDVPRAYLALVVRAMLQGGRLRGIATIAQARRARRRRTIAPAR